MRICLLMVLLYNPFIWAQPDFSITNLYTQKDGLSNSIIYDICEDSRGFLWLATYEGLSRFDGLHFKTYYHNKYEVNSLAHNNVRDLLEYQPGLLLIATANGLSVFNLHPGQFENDRIQQASLAPGKGANVTSLHQDKDGNIWVNQNGELDVLDSHLKFLYRFTDQEWASGLKGSMIIFEDWQTDTDGKLWLPTDTSGLQIIDFKNKNIYNRNHNPKGYPFMQFKTIRALLLDEKNNILYIAPWGSGLYRFDLNTGTELHQNFGQPLQEFSSINSIVRLDDGNLFCNSNGSFYRVDPVTLDYTRIEFPDEQLLHKPNQLIHPITIRKSLTNGYWIGANEGLIQMEDDLIQDEISFIKETGTSECVDLMVASNGDIYAIYENGTLIEADQVNGVYASYPIPKTKEGFITQMCEDKQQKIWIGTSDGIIHFDMLLKKFSKPVSAIAALDQSFVTALHCDHAGNIWIGTRQPFGIYQYQYITDELQKIENESILQMSRVGEYARISSIAQDHQGNLWMRSPVGGGILNFDRRKKTWHRYPQGKDELSLLENNGLYAMYPDTANNLWLSTNTGDGLIRYDYQNNKIEKFNREDGLLSDHIFQIEANGDKLWLTTEYGYNVFNTTDHTMISYNWSNISAPFEMIIDTTRDQMVIGLPGKLTFISTIESELIAKPPVPVIDGIYVNHQLQKIDPRTAKLRLAYNQKNVTIDFTTPYYSDVDKIKFAYYLVGADHEWQYPRDTRTAQYAALSSGTYVFQIKATDSRGQWGEAVDAFTFTIVPPLWKRPWFIVIVAMVTAAIIFLMLKKRVASIRYEASLKQKIAETEMMALRAQMNPHFIFNSLNSIDSLIHSDDKFQATLYLNKFARLIRNILDSSKQNTVSVEKDMETLRLYIELEQFRSPNSFTSDINLEPTISGRDIRVPPLIIQPFVENAILHGLRNRPDNKGHLNITLKRLPDGLLYVIEDNGVGRQFAKNGRRSESKSYGMQMSSDRIKIFNQEENASVKITDLTENGMPTGTRVEVNLKTI